MGNWKIENCDFIGYIFSWKVGAVVRACAFHQRGLGSILSSTTVVVCWFSALRGLSPVTPVFQSCFGLKSALNM